MFKNITVALLLSFISGLSFADITKVPDPELKSFASCLNQTRYIESANRSYSRRWVCQGFESFEGLAELEIPEKPLYDQWLLVVRTQDDLKNPHNETAPFVRKILLIGVHEQHLKTIGEALPNVTEITLDCCFYGEISELIRHFPNLRSLKFDTQRTKVDNNRKYQLPAFSMKGVPYDRTIYFEDLTRYHFSCDDLGYWSRRFYDSTKKILQFDRYVETRYLNCFESLHWQQDVKDLIRRGDSLYHKGDFNEAKNAYLTALEINPWDLRVLSSMSLVSYKLDEYCDGAHYGAIGSKQLNGPSSVIAAVSYNQHLNLKAIGQVAGALSALERSNRYVPSDSKLKAITRLKGIDNSIDSSCETVTVVQDMRKAVTERSLVTNVLMNNKVAN